MQNGMVEPDITFMMEQSIQNFTETLFCANSAGGVH